MARNSSDELKNEYTAELGNDFGEAYYLCRAEFNDTVLIWQQYENLFGHNEKKVDFLNEASGWFFYNVERLFFQAVLLGLCRLIDPKVSAGRTKKPNLTIQMFDDLMRTEAQKKEFTSLTKRVFESLQFARERRHGIFAHNDLALKLEEAKLSEDATRKKVNDAIDAFHAVFEFISLKFMNKNAPVSTVIPPLNDETGLIQRLYYGSLKEKEIRSEENQEIYSTPRLPDFLSRKLK